MNDWEHFELFLRGKGKHKRKVSEKIRFKSETTFEAPGSTKREYIRINIINSHLISWIQWGWQERNGYKPSKDRMYNI